MNQDNQNKINYLLVTLDYPPAVGGVAHYYSHLVKYWPDERPLAVLDNSRGQLLDEKRRCLKWWPAALNLRRSIKDRGINYLLIGQILPLGTAAWLLSKILPIRYAVFLHGYDFNVGWNQSRKRWLMKAVLKNADKIICANSYTAAAAQKAVTGLSDKTAVVNPGIDADPLVYDEHQIDDLKTRHHLHGKTVLLTVGRLVVRKGVDMALEGLNLALKRSPRLAFIIIGQGDGYEDLRAKIANLGLKDYVQILGGVDDEAKRRWYKLADIFIMTPRAIGPDVEGFGIVYLEAGLAGKPFIAVDSGVVADAVEDNVTGLLVDPLDSGAIAAAIVKLADYPNLRHRLGDAGRRRALRDFNWPGQAKKIYQVLSLKNNNF